MLNATLQVAAEASKSDVSPYAVGGLVLGLLFALVIALIAFGGGREHS